MSDMKNSKMAVWMYAVVLFTSAFVVLLLTAYSQIKFSRNIDDYKNRIYTEESEKNNVQMDLSSAIEENKKLKNEISSVRNELTNIKIKQEATSSDYSNLQKKYDQVVAAYEALIEAEQEFNRGNVTGCTIILHEKINKEVLEKSALEKYKLLVGKSYYSAAASLYEEGYRKYTKAGYSEAIALFNRSLELVTDGYYSDDCYYFIAYSEYRLGNRDNAKAALNSLLAKYPGSSFSKDALDLLKTLQ